VYGVNMGRKALERKLKRIVKNTKNPRGQQNTGICRLHLDNNNLLLVYIDTGRATKLIANVNTGI